MVDTCYTAGFMVTLFVLFFSGPDTWPNKRARMYHGYTVFLAALVVPTLVSVVYVPAPAFLSGSVHLLPVMRSQAAVLQPHVATRPHAYRLVCWFIKAMLVPKTNSCRPATVDRHVGR